MQMSKVPIISGYELLKKYSNSFDETALIYAYFGDGPTIFKTINQEKCQQNKNEKNRQFGTILIV